MTKSNTEKNILGLAEFRRLVDLPDSSILSMLAEGELAFTSDSGGRLQVNISELNPKLLAKNAFKKLELLDSDQRALFEESLASIMTEQLDDYIRDALELALRWIEAEQRD